MINFVFGVGWGAILATLFWMWFQNRRDESMPGAGLEKLREWFRQTVPAVCICESFSKIPGNPEFADVAWCGVHSILIANKNGVISESMDGIKWEPRAGSLWGSHKEFPEFPIGPQPTAGMLGPRNESSIGPQPTVGGK